MDFFWPKKDHSWYYFFSSGGLTLFPFDCFITMHQHPNQEKSIIPPKVKNWHWEWWFFFWPKNPYPWSKKQSKPTVRVPPNESLFAWTLKYLAKIFTIFVVQAIFFLNLRVLLFANLKFHSKYPHFDSRIGFYKLGGIGNHKRQSFDRATVEVSGQKEIFFFCQHTERTSRKIWGTLKQKSTSTKSVHRSVIWTKVNKVEVCWNVLKFENIWIIWKCLNCLKNLRTIESCEKV